MGTLIIAWYLSPIAKLQLYLRYIDLIDIRVLLDRSTWVICLSALLTAYIASSPTK